MVKYIDIKRAVFVVFLLMFSRMCFSQYIVINNTNIYEEPTLKSKILYTIPYGYIISLDKTDDDMLYISHNGFNGYISKSNIKPFDKEEDESYLAYIERIDDENRIKEEARQEALRERLKEKREVDLKIKKWGKSNYKLISDGKVRVGMTKGMCIEAWGNPESINKTSTRYGVSEQWVYDGFNYLYFENGRLNVIQSNE